MAARDNDNGDDIEALTSRAHGLLFCQVDTSNFAIGFKQNDDNDDDNDLEQDYDSITTCDGDNLPEDNLDGSVGAMLTPGTDFALAERTSEIISGYRDYLIVSGYRDYLMEVESAAAKNQALSDEMESLRGSLGLHKATSASARDPPDRSDEQEQQQCTIEIREEPRLNKYSPPQLHSRELKRRLLRAIIVVMVMGSIASFSFYSATTSAAQK
eukprot:CAMPEP_0183742120 /NCGR_PEP_ID=MMETSP0737-20130205/63960_1 /TAXON_ID=385413 /ORGANISM="Thalassiosira miniscula, Strain CCMP1093" /LENGTH=212 /DNA_ID=CAMNT_0025977647 /DNA_START=22 /DNA_END=657 /DNA_ORIENTATION=+